MARRQFLWIDPRGADCYFAAPGNIQCGAGNKGTLAIWQYTAITDRYVTANTYWRIPIDANNYMEQYTGRSFRVRSGGVTKAVGVMDYVWAQYGGHGYEWELMVYTWDFSGGAGHGVLRAYWDGAEAGTAVTDATAPVGAPPRLMLGPAAVSTYYPTDKHAIKSVSVWDDLMTAGQAADLFAQTHRHRIKQSDGTGNILLSAPFDGHLDADVAAGSPTLSALGSAERYCLMDEGIRKQGSRSLLLGTPRHDLSEDDRVPLFAALTPYTGNGQSAYFTATNYENYARFQATAGYTQDKPLGLTFAGAPAFGAMTLVAPTTYRQRIHVLNAGNPKCTFIRVGPVDYFNVPLKGGLYDQFSSGRLFAVVADGSNSVTQFKTDLASTYENGYWTGAEVTFLSGGCAGRRLKATGYDSTTKVLTMEGALPVTPAAADVGVVDFRAVLQGTWSSTGNEAGKRIPEMTMDAWLWDAYETNYHFTELEWCYSAFWSTANLNSINLLRYERGRTAYMDGSPGNIIGQAFLYGRPATWQVEPAFYCDIMLERVEVDGPSTYQVLRRDASGHGPSYSDNFMVVAEAGQSTKAWRTLNVSRVTQKPTKISTPALVKTDLQAAGTWRNTVTGFPIPVEYDEATATATVLVKGTSAAGVVRYGYCQGVWNETTGRIQWTDETPPAGKTNPFISLSDLRPNKATDAIYMAYGDVTGVLRGPDGASWYLTYMSADANDDHYQTYLLGPSLDRWSFTRSEHWWDGNPLMSIIGGPDRLAPESSGGGRWANRDADYRIVENTYAKDPSRRYWGWARGKTISHVWRTFGIDLRPPVGMRGADLRSMMPLPHGNQVTPLVGVQIHGSDSYVYGQSDCFLLYSDTAVAFTSGVYCYVSEDGVHWRTYATHSDWIPYGELTGEGTRMTQGRPFRLGDRTIYYYAGGVLSFAWCRVDGECWYELTSGQTTGTLETPLIEMPVDGWGALTLNAAPGDGQITVEALDETEEPISGFALADCTPVTDAVAHRVMWGANSLADVSASVIRLRFRFTTGGATRPRVYRWTVEDVIVPAVAGGAGGAILPEGMTL